MQVNQYSIRFIEKGFAYSLWMYYHKANER